MDIKFIEIHNKNKDKKKQQYDIMFLVTKFSNIRTKYSLAYALDNDLRRNHTQNTWLALCV